LDIERLSYVDYTGKFKEVEVSDVEVEFFEEVEELNE